MPVSTAILVACRQAVIDVNFVQLIYFLVLQTMAQRDSSRNARETCLPQYFTASTRRENIFGSPMQNGRTTIRRGGKCHLSMVDACNWAEPLLVRRIA